MKNEIYVDAEGAIFGRLCSFVAKKALEGNELHVVNSEKTIITGNRKFILHDYSELKKKGGHSLKGPRISAVSYKMLKRAIRGMIPNHRYGTGKETLTRVKCYNGVPEEFKDKKFIKIESPRKIKFMTLKDLSQSI
ncbi:50S ribosomal protein L13 [Candidatus Pacearchaeota archaeon]|nr:50S ribosomal protein L13 [Candidatus Pacearchaeota archaeon]